MNYIDITKIDLFPVVQNYPPVRFSLHARSCKQACGAHAQKKAAFLRNAAVIIAEREGFEPPEPFSSTVFKTAVIDHSTTSPVIPTKLIKPYRNMLFQNWSAKVTLFFQTPKIL